MGLSSFLNPDILIGMGRARQQERDNILTQESDRRKTGTSLLKSIYEHPDLTPEARDETLKMLSEATQADPAKPYKFDLERVLRVRPQVGQSVKPIDSIPTPDVGPNQYGLGPVDISQPMRAPEAPQDYRRSGFYSQEEKQRIVSDNEQRQLDNRQKSALATKRGELELEQEFTLPPVPTPPSDFTLSPGQSRFNPDGTIKSSVPLAPEKPTAPQLPRTVTTAEGVMQWDAENNKWFKIGDRPPSPSNFIQSSAQSYSDLDPKDRNRVNAVRDKVARGEYTISQGLTALGGVRSNLGGALTEALGNTRVLPTAVRQQNTDINRAKNIMVPLKKLVDEINKTSSMEQKIKKSVQLEQYIQSIGTQFARAKGERGVVTDRDVNRVLGLIPGWKSSNFAPDYAQENLKLIDEAFDRDQNALLNSYFDSFEIGEIPPPNPSIGGTGGGNTPDAFTLPNGTTVRRQPDGTYK